MADSGWLPKRRLFGPLSFPFLFHRLAQDDVVGPVLLESLLAQEGGELSAVMNAVQNRLDQHLARGGLPVPEAQRFESGPIFGGRLVEELPDFQMGFLADGKKFFERSTGKFLEINSGKTVQVIREE